MKKATRIIFFVARHEDLWPMVGSVICFMAIGAGVIGFLTVCR